MLKNKSLIVTVLLVITVAALGVYATGIFQRDEAVHTENLKYPSGGFTYSGDLVNGAFDGYGSVQFHEGGQYSGGFSAGRYSGDGTFTNSANLHDERWFFSGTFGDGRINSGTFILQDDSVAYERNAAVTAIGNRKWLFEGGLNERGQNGTGTFIFANGDVYTGGFKDGLANDEGTYKDATGRTVYTGGFKDGLFDGRGVYTSAEGWIYDGYFKDGLFDGAGVFADGTNLVRGVWEKGAQVIRYE
jgi:hypothetical protein